MPQVTPCLSALYPSLPRVMDCNEMPDEIYWVKYMRLHKIAAPRLFLPEHIKELEDEDIIGYLESTTKRIGPMVMFPLPFLTTNTGFLFRSFFGKEFSLLHDMPFHCYVPSWFYTKWKKTVTYGQTWILCEGIMDAEVLGEFYPYVLGILSSGPSRRLCEWLSGFTNNVIVCPDNDEAGATNYRTTHKRMRQFGISVQKMKPPEPLKDAGDIARLALEGEDVTAYRKYFESGLSMLLGG